MGFLLGADGSGSGATEGTEGDSGLGFRSEGLSATDGLMDGTADVAGT